MKDKLSQLLQCPYCRKHFLALCSALGALFFSWMTSTSTPLLIVPLATYFAGFNAGSKVTLDRISSPPAGTPERAERILREYQGVR